MAAKLASFVLIAVLACGCGTDVTQSEIQNVEAPNDQNELTVFERAIALEFETEDGVRLTERDRVYYTMGSIRHSKKTEPNGVELELRIDVLPECKSFLIGNDKRPYTDALGRLVARRSESLLSLHASEIEKMFNELSLESMRKDDAEDPWNSYNRAVSEWGRVGDYQIKVEIHEQARDLPDSAAWSSATVFWKEQ